MDKSDIKDLAVEQRNKYGTWDDDIDDLAAGLDGRRPDHVRRNQPLGSVPNTVEVDESFWRATRDSSTKYGR